MSHADSTLAALFKGWHDYQNALLKALVPLSDEQLTLRAAPNERTIGEMTAHIIGARAGWFYELMGEGGELFADMRTWDEAGAPTRNAAELVEGVETSWRVMHEAIARWAPAEWEQVYKGERNGQPYEIPRRWVIWHLIEHDLHHGGEISLTLGMHGLTAPDI